MLDAAALEVLNFSRRHVSQAVDTVRRPVRTIRLFFKIRRDVLPGLIRLANTEGDRLEVRLGRARLLLLSAPADVHEVLVSQYRAFHKPEGPISFRRVLGDGVLTSEGEIWRRGRRLILPAFHSDALQPLGAKMVELTLRRMDEEWRGGAEYDIVDEMTSLTFAVATEALFGFQDADLSAEVRDSISSGMRYASRRMYKIVRLPTWIPNRGTRAAKRLRRAIGRILDEREKRNGAEPDLLSLIRGADESGGDGFTPEELKDQALTLLLAGHETTASALGWTWHLLSQNPAALARLESEIRTTLGGTLPSADNIRALPYLEAVVQEALRLFPPVWGLTRQAVEPFSLGSRTFPTGTRVVMLPWVIHRQASYFSRPDEFDPGRWLDGSMADQPRHAYIPFGAGPRTCIGRSFALMEMRLIIATVLQRYRMHAVPGHVVVAEALVTLRARQGVRVVLEPRTLVPDPPDGEEPFRPLVSETASGGCPFHEGAREVPS